MKTILITLTMVFVFSFVLVGYSPSQDWRVINQLGTAWFIGPEHRTIVANTMKQDFPPIDNICYDDLPQIDYVVNKLPPPQEQEQETPMFQLFNRIGRWSIRTLHIWGYDDIDTSSCKSPLGWGTVFALWLYGDKLIWVTVDHNVNTDKYISKMYATNWFIRDNAGQWRELLLIGCRQVDGPNHKKFGKYCVLMSSLMAEVLPINLFNENYIVNDINVLDETYLYGCSLVSERVVFLVHYRLHFFCLGNKGYVNSPHSLIFNSGGDVLVSNPAMPGFSGSPLLNTIITSG